MNNGNTRSTHNPPTYSISSKQYKRTIIMYKIVYLYFLKINENEGKFFIERSIINKNGIYPVNKLNTENNPIEMGATKPLMDLW